jgi:hypothetical protein
MSPSKQEFVVVSCRPFLPSAAYGFREMQSDRPYISGYGLLLSGGRDPCLALQVSSICLFSSPAPPRRHIPQITEYRRHAIHRTTLGPYFKTGDIASQNHSTLSGIL